MPVYNFSSGPRRRTSRPRNILGCRAVPLVDSLWGTPLGRHKGAEEGSRRHILLRGIWWGESEGFDDRGKAW